MKTIITCVPILLSGGMGLAGEVTKCVMDYTCVNTAPCKPTPMEFEFETLPDNELRLDLGGESVPILKVMEASTDLMSAHGLNREKPTAYAFSLFSDGMFAYSTHTFVDQGVSLTSLGHCEVAD
ncbi:hypothetical protein SAMN05444007_11741 [Cribrihabitans marinus]|uniref:Uncharacterized protein n=1 Tax=Cribrihabitans marinus TaxID=1227549 RepID=A0A1H7DZ99_9RHOB|nr:hypothetical protein [Cribrihabitans marinus]GGH17930.1 hypothetical protein GCM10010973_00400 [Cribrihabitans marinus]SEK07089.1 hypothetical protein SAMN05444007_11741 [Cribrihabitans marinus]